MKNTVDEYKTFLLSRKVALIGYMYSCIELEDYHGVSDAANDLREVVVELDLIENIQTGKLRTE